MLSLKDLAVGQIYYEPTLDLGGRAVFIKINKLLNDNKVDITITKSAGFKQTGMPKDAPLDRYDKIVTRNFFKRLIRVGDYVQSEPC